MCYFAIIIISILDKESEGLGSIFHTLLMYKHEPQLSGHNGTGLWPVK